MQMTELNAIPYPFILLDTLNEGIYMLDRQWRCIYVNSRGSDIAGKSREEMYKKNVWELFPYLVGTLPHKEALYAIEKNRPRDFEVYYPQRGQWLEIHYYPCPGGLCILIQDITGRKHQEEQLHFQASILNTIQESIIATNLEGKIIYWNKGAERLFGYTAEEVLGQNGNLLYPPQVPQSFHEIMEQILAGKDYAEEGPRRCKDGTLVWTDIRATLLHSSDGKPLGFLGLARDVTERKELEQRKDDFINMASHELKTPITALKGLAQVLIKKLEQQGIQEPATILNTMDTQIDRLTKMIDDLLNVSKIQAGRLEYERQPVDIDTLVRETVSLLQNSISTHTLQISGTTQAVVMGDRDRLGQVLNNLIINAIKYSPQANTVDITLTRTLNSVRIAVRDYGIGISQTAQQHIFDRFYRVDTKTVPGLGMGLYIAYEIVKRHGGELSVQSEEGKGSTFVIALPIEACNRHPPPDNA